MKHVNPTLRAGDVLETAPQNEFLSSLETDSTVLAAENLRVEAINVTNVNWNTSPVTNTDAIKQTFCDSVNIITEDSETPVLISNDGTDMKLTGIGITLNAGDVVHLRGCVMCSAHAIVSANDLYYLRFYITHSTVTTVAIGPEFVHSLMACNTAGFGSADKVQWVPVLMEWDYIHTSSPVVLNSVEARIALTDDTNSVDYGMFNISCQVWEH